MNAADHRSDNASPQVQWWVAGIGRWLVRLVPSGQLLWAGSVHRVPARRGDDVIVSTSTGVWWAEVLSVVPPADPDRSPPGEPVPGPLAAGNSQSAAAPLAGELLRLADADDRTALAAASGAADRLRAAAAEWLDQQHRTDAPAATILSTEVSLDGRVGVVGVLGPTDARFGPAAAQLADRMQLQRVQWVNVQEGLRAGEAAASGSGSGGQQSGDFASEGPQQAVVMSPERAADELFWQRFQQDARYGRSLGKEHRVAAGNRGLYQQKRRGAAPPGRRLTTGRSWMVRVRTAAGGIAPGQLDQLIQLALQFGDGSLRLTSRQAIQLHGVVSEAAGDVLQRLQQAALFAAGSCGNAVRNLTCCPLPPRDPMERMARRLAVGLAADLLPRGPAFEFHLGASADADAVPPVDSVAGSHAVLPHKWKVGVTSGGHNCIDVLTNDFAVVLCRAGNDVAGTGPADSLADLYVGGSTAYQAGRPDSFPALAQWLGRVPVSAVSAVAGAALGVFRQSDGKSPRHWRRWKYTVQRWGIDDVVDRIQQAGRGGFVLVRDASEPPVIAPVHTHAGQWRQIDGRLAIARPVPGGRLLVAGDQGAALRRLAGLAGSIRVGPRHTLVLADIAQHHQQAVQTLMDQLFGTEPADTAVACPALPTCPLAVAAAETECRRWLESLRLVASAANVPVPDLAVSGCANGCSHPLTTAVGVVAESPRQWRVYLGGDGRRIGTAVAIVGDQRQFATLLGDWLQRFSAERTADEPFGDWFWRRQNG